jgi:5-amino-6-(5-phosphoribosylamino)uracil reductase
MTSVEHRSTADGDVAPRGPGTPFELLFDDSDDPGRELPEAWRQIYPTAWSLPARTTRPYVFSNFVVARDGRVSFNEPGKMSGADVSGFDEHDRWLMALLRARADAIVMGDNTLRIEPDHLWTAEFIFPSDADALAALRRHEGRTSRPLQVFLSLEGDIDPSAARVFSEEGFHVVVATTTRGAARLRTLPPVRARLDILELGDDAVDVPALLAVLRERFDVETVLCEGGPRAYGSMLAAGCIDDEFLALSPLVVGAAPDVPRPSLIEGVAFAAAAAPYSKPLTLHRAGDLLFLRARYAPSSAP